eukprot:5647203-Pyramimonas_sp.AAC.1
MSVPALEMLDGHIHVRDKSHQEMTALGITLPLIKMKDALHLGVGVSQFGGDQGAMLQKMDLKSARGDSLVHLASCVDVVKGGYAYLENDDGDDEDGLAHQQDIDCHDGKLK